MEVHCRRINLGNDPDAAAAVIGFVASLTPNTSGAELAALVNEAVIRAVRRTSAGGAVVSSPPVVLARDFTDAINTSNEARGKTPGGPVGQMLKDFMSA